MACVQVKIHFPVLYVRSYLPIQWEFLNFCSLREKLAEELDVESCIKIECDHCDSK